MKPCPPKKPLSKRDLISLEESKKIGGLFKLLVNDTRLRLLHALIRSKELCVGDLAKALQMKPQAVSNQLQRLVDRGVLKSRRDKNQIYYQMIDPCIAQIMERGICLLEDAEARKTKSL